jgi:hypothetical protein
MNKNKSIRNGLKLGILLVCIVFLNAAYSQNSSVGNKSFVHLEKTDNVWWFVDGDGNPFVSTGMNHIQQNIRFASYNKDYWAEKFGKNILVNGKFNPNATPEIKKWMEQVAKDYKDYGFTTIAFHRALNIPDEYFEELEIFYLGKIKTAQIHAMRARKSSKTGKFPDVFSEEFQKTADEVAKNYCSKHKNNKFLLGYTYEDLPSYEYSVYKNKYLKNKNTFEYHPWIIDIINKEGTTKGKEVWMNVLKQNYSSLNEVSENYNIELKNWEDIGRVSIWTEPNNKEKWLVDQMEMNKHIVDMWHKTNRDVILKYDPNHLILGDKINCHGNGHPDWVYEIVGKYVDVLLIQDYEFFKPLHVEKLKRFYSLSGKPILSGDHSYAFTVKEMDTAKGLAVESHVAVGEEYNTYLKGIMNLPFMLGWHNCGYLEQWKGGRLDDTGKQQTGLFDPFGNPRTDALELIEKANIEAIPWHENAGKAEFEYSKRKPKWQSHKTDN